MWLLEALNGDPEHPSTSASDTVWDSAKSRQRTCPLYGSREPLSHGTLSEYEACRQAGDMCSVVLTEVVSEKGVLGL